ncbi:hypothetical protein VB715_20995 [Crocosphaera sp. UHCC 0190]|uniref:DUF6908 domain-containing protein n=1 Tax=Crocosphaera sp. UHCC 0190 TaxID=3110246 RepID=UPI002B1EC981|nr:hypothetical protein [Crocosphaera sp. UHCC 0190]MEA5512252.1 hypothetical protein [Crocosphaera sp. UHCC 0190]
MGRLSEIISVAHYQEINGDLVADPDISFKIYHLTENQQSWIPLEIRQVMAWRTVSYLENNKIVRFSPKGQKEIASFCSMWADNLKSQGWHIKGKTNPKIKASSSYFTPLT